jgi:hypothetical protein
LLPIQTTDTCLCPTLPDLAVTPMRVDGVYVQVFATLERVRDHGGDQWWLYLSRCAACGQHWMVAQEERIYDTFFLKRLSPAAATSIVTNDVWPGDFLSYEQVILLGREKSTPPRFLDAFAYSLQFTVEDLRMARPDITWREIAYLLGLTPGHAWRLYWKVRLFGVARLPT